MSTPATVTSPGADPRPSRAGSASIAAHLEAHYRSRPTKILTQMRRAFLLDGDEGLGGSAFARARIALIDQILTERGRAGVTG